MELPVITRGEKTVSDLLHRKSDDDRSRQRDSEVAEGLAVWRLNWQVCSQAILPRSCYTVPNTTRLLAMRDAIAVSLRHAAPPGPTGQVDDAVHLGDVRRYA